MECYRDYFSLKGCGATEPESGLYVNSLPAISSLLASKIADSEQVTYLGLWNDVQDRALKKFASSVIQAFKSQKSYKIKTVAQMVDLGRLFDDSVPLAASAQYRGFTVEISFPSHYYSLESALQVIYVQDVSLYSSAIKTVTFKVFDLDTGEELDSFEADVVAGWNTIRVADSYDAYRIFVGYDATDFESVALSISNTAQDSCHECGACVFGDGECDAVIHGAATVDLADPTQYTKGSDTFGLSANFSIQCRYDWVVCANKELFSIALQNLLGAELLTNLIYSNRINWFTQPLAKEDASKLRDELLMEFDKELGIAVNGIDISRFDCCIECEATIQKPYLVP